MNALDHDKKYIAALTFDDGPNTVTTPQVLDILEKYHVPASFFLVGDNITDESAAAVRRAYEMGCDICNHSKTHTAMTEQSDADIRAEIEFTSNKIKEITGKEPCFFRPPYIAVDDRMYGLIPLTFICGMGCEDWEHSVSVDDRVEKTLEQAEDGIIILMHDMAGNFRTVQAIDRIIPEMKSMGYEFVTVSQLFKAKGVAAYPFENGERNMYSVVK